MTWKLSLAPAMVLLLGSCHAVTEPQANRIVHAGESAILRHPAAHPVCTAIDKSDVHVLARAVDGGDTASVQQLIADHKVLQVEDGTAVYVERESFNERQVRIEEGPHKGERVWVPFAWLRAANTAGIRTGP